MPGNRETSIAIQTNKTPFEYIALAQHTNQYDFDAVSVYSDLPFHPAYGPLFLMAPHIKKARLGPAGVSPSRMAPIDMAANAALLHASAPGGSYLGIVRGAWSEQFGIRPLPRALQSIRECARIVQQLWRGEEIDPVSSSFPMPSHSRLAVPLPDTEIPILIGTWGPHLAKLACEFASEVKIGGSANPSLATHMANILRNGETLHNRTPKEVKLVMGCVTVVDEDRTLAREIARQAVARYLTVVYPLDPTISIDPEWLERLEDRLKSEDLNRAAALISDEILDIFALTGRPHDIIERCQALYEAGVDRIEFGTPHGVTCERGISLLGKQVLPSLK